MSEEPDFANDCHDGTLFGGVLCHVIYNTSLPGSEITLSSSMVWLGIYRLTRFVPLPLLLSHRRHKNNKRETSVDDANGTRLTTMPEEAEEEEDGGITIKVGGNYHPEGQLEQTLFLALRRSTAVACFARVSLVSSRGSVWLLLSRSCPALARSVALLARLSCLVWVEAEWRKTASSCGEAGCVCCLTWEAAYYHGCWY